MYSRCGSSFKMCFSYDRLAGFMGFLWSVFFQAEDGIRDLVRSRGLGDVYKRQVFSLFRLVYSSNETINTIYMLSRPKYKRATILSLSLIHI
mgnify:CR=1 FL=1